MSGVMCVLAGSSGSLYAGAAIVTVGYYTGGSFSSYGFQGVLQGSITPSTWAGTGFAFSVLKDVYSSGSPAWLDFTVNGDAPNSGWTTLSVGGTSINRADASYFNGGSVTSWIFYGAPTLFGTSVGATKEVLWS